MSNRKKRTPSRARLYEHLNLALAAFAIAFVAWVFAKTGETEEATLTIPVIAGSADPGMEVRISPAAIPVELRYPKDMRNQITSENFHFEVDVSDLKTGLGLDWKTKTQLLSDKDWVANIVQAGRIRLTRIGTRSSTVEVKLRWDAKPALVEPDIAGADRLPEGFQLLTPVKVTPREIWIAGDPDALASIPRDDVTSRLVVKTEIVGVGGRSESALESVGLRLPAGVEIVQPPSKRAEVNIEIQEVQTISEIRNVKLDFKALAPESVSLEYSPRIATVKVKGPVSLLRQLKSESFEVILQRPAEEVPGQTKEVPLEARFSNLVPEDWRLRLSIQSIDPPSLKLRYVAKAPPPAR